MQVHYEETFETLLQNNRWNEDYSVSEVEKLKQAIEVHGYRGPSKKKHNGIVPIRPSDSNLLKTLKILTNRLSPDMKEKCNTGYPIKVVAHVPTGWRMVGYRWSNGNILILGMANHT